MGYLSNCLFLGVFLTLTKLAGGQCLKPKILLVLGHNMFNQTQNLYLSFWGIFQASLSHAQMGYLSNCLFFRSFS
jgi:hypothetical protein